RTQHSRHGRPAGELHGLDDECRENCTKRGMMVRLKPAKRRASEQSCRHRPARSSMSLRDAIRRFIRRDATIIAASHAAPAAVHERFDEALVLIQDSAGSEMLDRELLAGRSEALPEL